MLTGRGKLDRSLMGVAALILLLLGAAITLLNLAVTPTRGQIEAADPPVRVVLAFGAGTWPITIVVVLTAAYWLRGSKRLIKQVRKAAPQIAAGAAAGLLLPIVLRLLVGANFPDFVPPEESAKAGMPYGLAAGLLEETLIRLIVLPAALVWLRRYVAAAALGPLAVVASGLVFALAHEVGPGAGSFRADHFLVRALVPGCGFSAAALLLGPPFIVVAHISAHVTIALLF